MTIKLHELVAMGEKRFCVPPMRAICEPTILRGGGRGELDYLETDQICALGRVVDRAPINARTLSIWMDCPEEAAEQCLEALEWGGFVKLDESNYSPTELGEQVVKEIGEEIVKVDTIWLKRYIEDIERLI